MKGNNLVVHGGIAYFLKSADSLSETGLWRSDGTAAGTYEVAGFEPEDDQDEPELFSLTETGERLTFFIRSSYERTYENTHLFTSDGTPGGTVALASLRVPEIPSISADLNGTHLFYLAQKGEWWRSDGTEDGTFPFSDLSGQNVVLIPYAEVAGGSLFFAAEHAETGRELWKTDGTAAGTGMVRDILPGSEGSGPASLAEADGMLYFTCDDGVHGAELWKSDGTEAGTVLVGDLEPGERGSFPRALRQSGNRLFFTAERQGFGRELHSLLFSGRRGRRG